MRKLLTLTLILGLLSSFCDAQSKPKTISASSFSELKTNSTAAMPNMQLLSSAPYSTYNTFKQPDNYTYLFINGRVGFGAKKAWLLTIKDTTKLSIKFADTIFILHISPKFVTKLNDSTYTFKNQ